MAEQPPEINLLHERFAALEAEHARLQAEVQHLRAENACLRAEMGRLQAENAEWRRQLGLNNSNRHKPPSSDGDRRKRAWPALSKGEQRGAGGAGAHRQDPAPG